MKTFTDPKDPSETVDYEIDWAPRLSSGESVASQVVAFIDAAGTTNPTNSLASNVSRIWLAGGTHGSRCVFTVTVTTDGGRTLEDAFGVSIVDVVLGETAPTELETWKARLSEAELALHELSIGDKPVEIWRDGRRLTYPKSSIRELSAYVDWVKNKVANLEYASTGGSADGFTSQRRPFIPVY